MRAIVSAVLVVALSACNVSAEPTDQPEEPSSPATQTATPSAEATSLESPAPTPGSGLVVGSTAADSGVGYLAYFPPSYAHEGEPSPLLIFLHGAGEAGDGSEEQLQRVAALGIPRMIAAGEWPEEYPFIVLAPQMSVAKANNRCDVGDEIAAVMEWASFSYNVDYSRIYLTGISCGAIGVWDYLAKYGNDRAAAAVPVAGHALWALELGGCEPLTEVPIWAFHGVDDEVVPVDFVQGQIEQIRECEGAQSVEVELTLYPDTDHVGGIEKTYDLSAGHDIYAWLLEHTNDPIR